MDDEKNTGKNTEHRADHRHTLALDAVVHFCEQYVEGMFRCQTSNIGLHGAFLPSHDIPINDKTDVELVLLANTRPEPKQHRLKAKVMRASSDGAALSFPGLDDEQVRDFRRFLLKAKIAARKSTNWRN
jgi:hypothetical protein